MLNYRAVKSWSFAEASNTYSADDCILYALSVGMATDPFDEADLRYAIEGDLQVLPTFVATVGAPGAWASHPETGIDWMQILHGEHRMRFYRALPSQGTLLSQTRVLSIVDKGAGRGALVTTERDVRAAQSGELLAQIEHVSFCRADGGYSVEGAPTDTALPPLPAAPQRPAEASMEIPTQQNAALLYRLNGDRNPVHALPHAWRKAGFDRPILHGLCTYGMAARALIKLACNGNAARLRYFAARFSAPVFPGETLVLKLWNGAAGVGDQTLHFEVHVKERGVTVLSHGLAETQDEPLPVAESESVVSTVGE